MSHIYNNTCGAEGFLHPNITWWKISNEGEDSEMSVIVSDTGLLILILHLGLTVIFWYTSLFDFSFYD